MVIAAIFDPSKITTIYGVIGALTLAVLALLKIIGGEDAKKWGKIALILFLLDIALLSISLIIPIGGSPVATTGNQPGVQVKSPDGIPTFKLEPGPDLTLPKPNTNAEKSDYEVGAADEESEKGTVSYVVTNRMKQPIKAFHIHLLVRKGEVDKKLFFTITHVISVGGSLRISCHVGPFDRVATDNTVAQY